MKMINCSFGGNTSCARKARMSFSILASIALVAGLVACGGGGGGGTTTVTPAMYTANVTCPNDAAKTGTSTVSQSSALDVATAQCPVGVVLAVTPSDKSMVSPPTAIATTTDSTLDQSSLTTANVTLKAGQTAIAGTVTANGTKGFTFTPSAKLAFGQPYTFAASLKDGLGKALSVATTFTTSSVSCIAPKVPATDGQSCVDPVVVACQTPQVWTASLNACAYPIGVKVTGTNKLPAGCLDVHDQCWRDSVANGTVKWILTPAVATGVDNRPVAFAYFFNAATPSPTNGNYNSTIFFADTGLPISNRISDGNISEIDWVIGTAKGLISHYKPLVGSAYCLEMSWYPPTTQTGVNSNIWMWVEVACPAL